MGDREKYINEMARHLLNNNLALFIGAGFSRIFGYPNGKWGQVPFPTIKCKIKRIE